MMVMHDVTSYGKKNIEKIPKAIEFQDEITGMRFTVERICTLGTWMVSCKGYFGRVDLKTNDFTEATGKAKKYLIKHFRQHISMCEKFIGELEAFDTDDVKL